MKQSPTSAQSSGNAPQPQPPQGPPPWIGYMLILLGVPTGLVTLSQKITHNLTLTLVIIGVYYVGIGIWHFTVSIVHGAIDKRLETSTRQITTGLEGLFNRYDYTYRRALVEEFKMLGNNDMSINPIHALELEPIFVDLRIMPKLAYDSSSSLLPPHRVQSQPLVSEHEPTTNSIWDYLSGRVSTNQHFVILGAPGSGKTTLLKFLTLVLAQPKKHKEYVEQIQQFTFPILLLMRDHTQSIIDRTDFNIAHAVQEHMQKKRLEPVPVEWIERQLKNKVCLIMLDGLDEIADTATREKAIEWVKYQMWRYGENKFILTSRRYGYIEHPLSEVSVSHFEVQHFTPEQVEQFIHNWYRANEQKNSTKGDRTVRQRADKRAEDLLQRLWRKPALLELTINPLLLDMIATVHSNDKKLPEKRVELYAEICRVCLNKRAKENPIPYISLTDKQKLQILQPLAYHMMERGIVEISSQDAQRKIAAPLALIGLEMKPPLSIDAGDFLQAIKDTSGLLIEPGTNTYRFAHKTFQEYLASLYVLEENLEQVLVDRVAESWWHETILLYCAQADASRIINACLRGEPPTIEMLVLAFQCDDDKKWGLQPQVQSQLDKIIDKGVEDKDVERRRVISEALLKRRIQRMNRMYDYTYADTSLVSSAEYQLFLDEQMLVGKYRQPDHWQALSFPQNTGKLPVLGVRCSDALAFCKWLTERDRDKWFYRLPHPEEQLFNHTYGQLTMDVETGYWNSGGSFFWSHGREPDGLHRNGNYSSRLTDYINFLNIDLFLSYARDIDGAIKLTLQHRCIDEIAREMGISDFERDRGFTPATEADLRHALDRTHLPNHEQFIDIFIALISNRITLLLAIQENATKIRKRERSRKPNDMDDLITALLDASKKSQSLHLDLLLLKARFAGLAASEGILLIKERKRQPGS